MPNLIAAAGQIEGTDQMVGYTDDTDPDNIVAKYESVGAVLQRVLGLYVNGAVYNAALKTLTISFGGTTPNVVVPIASGGVLAAASVVTNVDYDSANNRVTITRIDPANGNALSSVTFDVAASANTLWVQFSETGADWHNVQTAADRRVRFARGLTQPPNNAAAWNMGFEFLAPSDVSMWALASNTDIIPIQKLDADLSVQIAPMRIRWKASSNFVASDFGGAGGVGDNRGTTAPNGPGGATTAFFAVWLGVARSEITDIQEGGTSVLGDLFTNVNAGTDLTLDGIPGTLYVSSSAVDISLWETRRFTATVSPATNLGEQIDTRVLALLAERQDVFVRYSADGTAWHETQVDGDSVFGIAVNSSRPPDDHAGWSPAIPLSVSGMGGGVTLGQVNAAIASALSTHAALAAAHHNQFVLTVGAVLDFASSSRTVDDRGKAWGVSPTNENAAALLSIPNVEAWATVGDTTVIPIAKLDGALAASSAAMAIAWKATSSFGASDFVVGSGMTEDGVNVPLAPVGTDNAFIGVWIGAQADEISDIEEGGSSLLGDPLPSAGTVLSIGGVAGTLYVSSSAIMVSLYEGRRWRASISAKHLGDVILNQIRGLVESWALKFGPTIPNSKLPTLVRMIAVNGATMTVTRADGTTYDVTLPTGMGGPGVTYTISISGRRITLTPSSGTAQNIDLPPDENTTYTLTLSGNILTLTPSTGSPQNVTLPAGGSGGSSAETRIAHVDSVSVANATFREVALDEDVAVGNDYQVKVTDDSTSNSVLFPRFSGTMFRNTTASTGVPTTINNSVTSLLTWRENITAPTQPQVSRWAVVKGRTNRELYIVGQNSADLGPLTIEVFKYPRGGGGGSAIAASDEGTALTAMLKSVNFTGDGVMASSDADGNLTVAIGAGATPTPPSLVGGFGPTATPTAALLTIQGVNGTLTFGALTSQFQYIGKRVSDGDITSIVFSDDESRTNQIGVFTKFGSTFMVNSVEYAIWVSNRAQTTTAQAIATVT